MKRTLRTIAIWVVVVLVVVFIGRSFVRSAPNRKSSEPPQIAGAPARVYGRVEPGGGEVYVTSPVTRYVTQVFVHEGDMVKKGQVLCRMENSVEQAELATAQANVETFDRTLAISEDKLRRDESLFANNAVTEYDLSQSRLAANLDRARLDAAQAQAQLTQVQIDQLVLRSPIDGKVYRFDVHLGQTLTTGDNSRIVLGQAFTRVRMFVEAWWAGRVKLGDEYLVCDAETGDTLGIGKVSYQAPYLGKRSFRTDDPQERFDTNYQEVLLDFEGAVKPAPIGTSVVAGLPLAVSSDSLKKH